MTTSIQGGIAAQTHFDIPPVFSLKGVRLSQIPPDAVLMDDAQAVLAASVSWLPAKNYGAVKTFVPHDSSGAALHWHCAVSEFRATQTPFARIWDKLGRNQVQHQQSHLSGLMKVARVRYISELQSIWTTLFSAVAPLSPRIYTIYQTSWLVEYSHRQRGIIVTLPVDLSRRDIEDISDLEERGIRGRYVAIEHLQEIDGDIIEWRRVSCRDPGGMIPKCWVQRHMGHTMAKENMAFIEWLSKIRDDGDSRNSGDDMQPDTIYP